MGVNTNGLVMTNEKNPFLVCSKINDAIHKAMLQETNGKDWRSITRSEEFAHPKFEMNPDLEMMTVFFTWKTEKRMLSIHFGCDCDGVDVGYYDGSKIIMSLGFWGDSVNLMRIALESLKEFGNAYLIENDCSDWQIEDCQI